MTAGLPGVGIGGIFYLLCALIMPFVELANTLRGRPSKKRWRVVVTQFGLLCSILAGFWLTGLLLAAMLKKVVPHWNSHLTVRQSNVFQIQPFFISLALLVGIVIVLHITNHIEARTRRRSPRRKTIAK